jgi:hypothetical protein
MAGGLMQLVSQGSQDIFLIGSPQITYFKILYRRHTNFSIESSLQNFIGNPNFGEEITCFIEKSGDLLNRIYVEIVLPKIDLVKSENNWEKNYMELKQEFENISKYRNLVLNYLNANIDVVRKLDIMINTNNISWKEIEDIINNPFFLERLFYTKQELIDYLNLNDKNFQQIQKLNTFDIFLLFLSYYLFPFGFGL